MSKLAAQPQRLADQETNWRRPRSPALAIPGAESHCASAKSSKGSASSSATAGPWSHFRRINGQADGRESVSHHAHQHQAIGFASYDALRRPRDASLAENWRAHQNSHVAETMPATLQSGSLGSNHLQTPTNIGSLMPNHHRKHIGFNASSNAAEVARRAFVASEIGSIGKASNLAASSWKNSDGTGPRSVPTTHDIERTKIEPAAPLEPLMVSNVNSRGQRVTISSRGESRPTGARRKINEDWAMTPTSSLPSLPASPVKKGRQEGAASSSWTQPTSQHVSSIRGTSMNHHRFDTEEDFQERTGAKLAENRCNIFKAGNAFQGDSPRGLAGSHFYNPMARRISQHIASSSPHRTLLSQATAASDIVASPYTSSPKQGMSSDSSPRRPTENLGKFRQNQGSPGPEFPTSQRSGSPAAMAAGNGPARKHSAASLSSFASSTANNYQLVHSRRDSLATAFSSPSAASVVSARSFQGVYRPPHLRNRSSANGLLLPFVAHYDRVRTPSLRGSLRSPESNSRPASTQPVALGLEDPVLNSSGSGPATSSLYFSSPRISSPSRGEGPHSFVERERSPLFQQVISFAGPRAGSVREESEEEELNLSHDEMMQVKTSLTDSYCFSRRSSMMSNFIVGNGVPVVDVFQIGDRLGPGMLHDGHPITIAETSDGFRRQQQDVTGTRLEVIDKLGEGSYAVVYLVKEIARDDQIHVGPKDDFSWGQGRGQLIAGRNLAVADEDADATLGDMTLPAGTLLGGRNGLHRISKDLDRIDDGSAALSSTLRATQSRDSDSFAARVAAEEQRDKDGAAEDGPHTMNPGLVPTLPGIDEPHEGRLFALKCLCKRDLSEEMLEVQRLEATIHQSIPPHANIVTLYRTYETPEWLFLVLEYCPGQDLFYWLEQAQDAEIQTSQTDDGASATRSSSGSATPISDHDGTPPSPSLLASTSGSGLLSRPRLRLISKMFRQMCEAVQFCHDRGVSHRDIKPENFIVEDRRSDGISSSRPIDENERLLNVGGASKPLAATPSSFASRHAGGASLNWHIPNVSVSTSHSGESSATALAKSSQVVVKLTDFGLATAEERCQDFDCGSKPYMAFECRNNITSYYDPQQADIWSLGIVLLNLIFHRSPFKEPNMEKCESFAAYCYDPIGFLTESFEGLTIPMAEFLSQKVFCNVVPRLDANGDAEGVGRPMVPIKRRVSARQFAEWVKDLPSHMGLKPHHMHKTFKRGYSVDLTSPLIHSRAPSSSSTLPSIFESPRGLQSNLVVEEDDDGGFGQHPLFPEYSTHVGYQGEVDGREQTRNLGSRSFLQTPESLSSPSFSSPQRASSRNAPGRATERPAASGFALASPASIDAAQRPPDKSSLCLCYDTSTQELVGCLDEEQTSSVGTSGSDAKAAHNSVSTRESERVSSLAKMLEGARLDTSPQACRPASLGDYSPLEGKAEI